MIRIPLVMKFPGSSFQSSKINVPVDLIDVAPTLCGFAAVDPPALFQGVDLATVILDPKSFGRRSLLSKALGTPQDSLRCGSRKMIRRRIKHDYKYYLFHRLENPGEIRDLAQKESELYESLLKIFKVEMNRFESVEIKSGSQTRLKKEEEEILRSLGYISSEDSN